MRTLQGYQGIEVYGKEYTVRIEVEALNGKGNVIYWIDPGTGCPPIANSDLKVGLEWAAAEIASAILP